MFTGRSARARLFAAPSRPRGRPATCWSSGRRTLPTVTVTSFFPPLPDVLLSRAPHLVAASAPIAPGGPVAPAAPAAPAARATQRRRRLRLARTLARVSVRSALLPRGASRSRQRLRVCGSADILTALGVRVQVVGGAVPWPRLGRVVVSDHTEWLGDLALATAVPGTPVIGRSTRALPVGSVACPVALRYRTADGYLARHEVPQTLAQVTAARDLVVEVHRLPALSPVPAAAAA